MGTVTKTIGSGARDFSTLSGWAASLPANLVTDGNSYVGQCFNDTEFTSTGTILALSGHTTDATHTITLTTGAGQSFRDNASAQTNRLGYVAANGVAITSSITFGVMITCSDNNVTFSNLQIKASAQPGGGIQIAGDNNVLKNCIVESNTTANGDSPLAITGSNFTAINSLFWNAADGALLVTLSGGHLLENCTFAKAAGGSWNMLVFSYSGVRQFKNCAAFGSSVLVGGAGTAPTFTTCAVDSAIASPPAGCTGVTYSTSQFANITNAAYDLKLVSGSALLDVGTTISAASPDIVGTTRPQGSAYDIGAWELVVGGVTVVMPWPFMRGQRVH